MLSDALGPSAPSNRTRGVEPGADKESPDHVKTKICYRRAD